MLYAVGLSRERESDPWKWDDGTEFIGYAPFNCTPQPFTKFLADSHLNLNVSYFTSAVADDCVMLRSRNTTWYTVPCDFNPRTLDPQSDPVYNPAALCELAPYVYVE